LFKEAVRGCVDIFFAEQFAEVMILGLKGEQLWFVQKQVYLCIPKKINGLRSQNCNIFFF